MWPNERLSFNWKLILARQYLSGLHSKWPSFTASTKQTGLLTFCVLPLTLTHILSITCTTYPTTPTASHSPTFFCYFYYKTCSPVLCLQFTFLIISLCLDENYFRMSTTTNPSKSPPPNLQPSVFILSPNIINLVRKKNPFLAAEIVSQSGNSCLQNWFGS